jgi:hypothetical protein
LVLRTGRTSRGISSTAAKRLQLRADEGSRDLFVDCEDPLPTA